MWCIEIVSLLSMNMCFCCCIIQETDRKVWHCCICLILLSLLWHCSLISLNVFFLCFFSYEKVFDLLWVSSYNWYIFLQVNSPILVLTKVKSFEKYWNDFLYTEYRDLRGAFNACLPSLQTFPMTSYVSHPINLHPWQQILYLVAYSDILMLCFPLKGCHTDFLCSLTTGYLWNFLEWWVPGQLMHNVCSFLWALHN